MKWSGLKGDFKHEHSYLMAAETLLTLHCYN